MIDVETFISICFTSFFLFLFFIFLMKIYLTLTIGRKFDQLFPYPTCFFLMGEGLGGKITRAHFYASFVMTKNKSARRLIYENYYSDYDFYGNVTPFQRKICLGYFICYVIAFTSGGAGYFLCKICHLCSG